MHEQTGDALYAALAQSHYANYAACHNAAGMVGYPEGAFKEGLDDDVKPRRLTASERKRAKDYYQNDYSEQDEFHTPLGTPEWHDKNFDKLGDAKNWDGPSKVGAGEGFGELPDFRRK